MLNSIFGNSNEDLMKMFSKLEERVNKLEKHNSKLEEHVSKLEERNSKLEDLSKSIEIIKLSLDESGSNSIHDRRPPLERLTETTQGIVMSRRRIIKNGTYGKDYKFPQAIRMKKNVDEKWKIICDNIEEIKEFEI